MTAAQLDRTKPPPPDKSGSWHLCPVSSDAWKMAAIDAAWAIYQSRNDPPGSVVREDYLYDDDGAVVAGSLRWAVDVGEVSLYGEDDGGFASEAEARTAAWAIYWRGT